MGTAEPTFAGVVGQITPADRLVSALLELSAAQGGVRDLAPVLTELACAVSGVDGAAVELVDGPDVVYIAATGLLAGALGLRIPRSGSLSGLVIATASCQVCADTTNDTRVDRVACERLGVGSMAIVPIRHENHTIAVLKLAGADRGTITEQHVRVVEPLVQAASARLAQAEAAESAAAQLELLNDVAAAGKDVLLADDPAQRLAEAVNRIIDAPHVFVLLPGAPGSLRVTHAVGADLVGVETACDESTSAGTAFVTGRPQIVTDWTANPKVSADDVKRAVAAGIKEARAAAFIPLETPDGPAGVLSVVMHEPITASNADLLGLLRLLAAEAGIAITRDDLRRRLADQARTDPLTGLANRRVWNERLETERERARRSTNTFAVALLDLDFFKRYNDTFGHPAGDELLRSVAAAWSAGVRPTDLLARLGGEEFAVLLPDTDLAAASVIAMRLCSVVPRDQTVSIGVTLYVCDEDPAVTMQRADQALYAAKAGGRNQVVSR
jgi:diguanylate cyclase (GGDEF)-like protein